jgi:hypothetical protein
MKFTVLRGLLIWMRKIIKNWKLKYMMKIE